MLNPQPQYQDFHIDGIQHVAPNHAYTAVVQEQAILLDVREPIETSNERINLPDVLYHPLSAILDRLKYIPKGKTIIVACTSGTRSVKIANLLKVQGFADVANLDGGIEQWKKMQLPCHREQAVTSACGCTPVAQSDTKASSCCSDSATPSGNNSCCTPQDTTRKISLSSGCGCSSDSGSCC